MVFKTGDRVTFANGKGDMLVIDASIQWVHVQHVDEKVNPLQREQEVLKPDQLIKGGPGSGRRPSGYGTTSTDHLAANSAAATAVHGLRNTLTPAEPLTRTAIAASESAHTATRNGVRKLAQDRHSAAGIAHMNAANAIRDDHTIPNNRHTANLHERASDAHFQAAQALEDKS